ncbi:MAG TPA: L-aspartate oxidase [Alcaligenes sp.]|nr:L-aspartate oxidase [Alcaligenes sp.]HRL21724.1 L-aspartate oxidase [Alcaligenes sp.]HRL27351.1 L-aspartate oxidase [Alcaligenes sp.]HRL27366.1 L-aspartate oxidase [Alcaligenes sp.]
MGTHVLIVGAGLAGLTLALSLPRTLTVTIISHAPLPGGASPCALGGIAAAIDPQDSLEQHVLDTLNAGAQHADPQRVQAILQSAPQAVQWLLEQHVAFDRTADGALHLTREGGHGQRRIVHAADASGQAIMQALTQRLFKASHIQVRSPCQVLALRRNRHGAVAGVDLYDHRRAAHQTLQADHVVLATGGLGRLYAHSTNPEGALGHGVALAWRVGATIQDLEFVQFHPTCLRQDGPPLLLTEALRGEGAHLLDAQGQRFMPTHDRRAELAPRDIVARAIDEQMRRDDQPHVWLDARHLGPATLQRQFPRALQQCLQRGFDLRRDCLPVAPAAHYACGGVLTDLHGHSSIAGLYAVGEVACTGLHGANRLASNSLLECVIMGRAAARAIIDTPPARRASLEPLPVAEPALPRPDPSLLELQTVMQTQVGLRRHHQGLTQAAHTLADWRTRLASGDSRPARTALGLSVDTAWLLTQAALAREHSLGAHYRLD